MDIFAIYTQLSCDLNFELKYGFRNSSPNSKTIKKIRKRVGTKI